MRDCGADLADADFPLIRAAVDAQRPPQVVFQPLKAAAVGIVEKLPVRRQLPARWVPALERTRTALVEALGGWMRAQGLLLLLTFGGLSLGLLLLRVDLALLSAALIALLDLLPVFGTGTVLIPWAVIKVISGEYAFAAGLALIYVLTQVVRQIIQPKIVGDTIGLSPLTTLLFLYLGYRWAGLGGMIVAVPIGMFVFNLYEFGMFDSLIDNLKLFVHDVNEFRKKKE